MRCEGRGTNLRIPSLAGGGGLGWGRMKDGVNDWHRGELISVGGILQMHGKHAPSQPPLAGEGASERISGVRQCQPDFSGEG